MVFWLLATFKIQCEKACKALDKNCQDLKMLLAKYIGHIVEANKVPSRKQGQIGGNSGGRTKSKSKG